ncbi:Nn.00g031810.m01.CDS01 [Neocucurbitaria sp. VM-36]
MAEATAPLEDVAHDDLCPICQLLLFAPVRTQCNHLLCASCMAQWADVSSTNRIQHAFLDVNIDDFDPNYVPSFDLETNCPMCRTRTTASSDDALATQLEQKYPTTYAERRVEDEVDRGSRLGEDGVEGVMILIGNKHRLVRGSEDDNEHDWTFFVRTSRPDIVKEVRVDLHPTFRPPRLTLRNPPYEVRRLGWGWFTIEAEIILKEPYSWVIDDASTRQPGLLLPWTLDFEGRARQGRVRARVKRIEAIPTDMAAQSLANGPDLEDEDDEEDDDYEAGEDGETSSDDEDDDEDASEYVGTPSRR